jgi:hypothetical protein
MKVNINSFFIEITSMVTQVILAMAVAALFSQSHINLYYYQWAALAVVVCLLFKNVKPQPTTSLSARYKSWLTIAGFQFLLFAVFYGISNYFGPHAFTQIIQYNTTNLGFAPWGLMLLVAVTLRIVMHKTGQDTSLVDTLGQLFKIRHGSSSWILLNLTIRSTTNVIIGITLTLLCLNIIFALSGPFKHFSMLSIIISFIVVLLALLKKCQPLYKKVVSKRDYLFFMLPLFTTLLALGIALLCYLLSGLGSTLTQTPGIISLLDYTYAPHLAPLLFGQGWWMAWSIVGGVFIASKSRYIGSREMLLISAVVPIIIYLLTRLPSINSALTTHHWSVIIGMLGIIGLLKLLFQKDMLPCTIINYLPAVEHPKQRSHQFYMIKVIKALLMVLFFAIPIGMQIPAFFSSMIVMPFILMSLCLLLVGLRCLQT